MDWVEKELWGFKRFGERNGFTKILSNPQSHWNKITPLKTSFGVFDRFIQNFPYSSVFSRCQIHYSSLVDWGQMEDGIG